MYSGSAYRKPAGSDRDLSDYLGADGSLYDGILCGISQKCRAGRTVGFKRSGSFYRIDEEMEEKMQRQAVTIGKNRDYGAKG